MKKRVCFRVLAVFVVVAGFAAISPAAAQSSKPFQGEWEWIVYARSRSELPPAFRGMSIREAPNAALYLEINQKGTALSGEYSAIARFSARLEEGEFDAVVDRNSAILELGSGFGGTLTAKITLRQNKLYWKIIKSEGEHYFPREAVLRRVVRKKQR